MVWLTKLACNNVIFGKYRHSALSLDSELKLQQSMYA